MLEFIAGQLLPWLVGCVTVASLWRARVPGRAGIVLGYGYLVGSLALTLWMRVLNAVGVAFGWTSIALPLVAATAGVAFFAWRGGQARAIASPREAPRFAIP